MVASMDVPAKGGFSFDLCPRNGMLEKKGLKVPGFRKTGTTIVGLVFADGVVLGADTRATEGPIVADKNCEKIHYMAPNIYCCGAGTAADTEAVTDIKVMLALPLFSVELIVLDHIYTRHYHLPQWVRGPLLRCQFLNQSIKKASQGRKEYSLYQKQFVLVSSMTWVVAAMSMFV
ncbi:hypothetical protein PVAP13_5KG523000 [Panicum virgatum]|uniref:proteasome endopeptidase complex n=1 Tax=Panicum virgatum TaxID=38727 RepID=A0A8T0S995_PANVG|nr:hypothetical protein PVAP13_5KG523000 [Panicum virgatum]